MTALSKVIHSATGLNITDDSDIYLCHNVSPKLQTPIAYLTSSLGHFFKPVHLSSSNILLDKIATPFTQILEPMILKCHSIPFFPLTLLFTPLKYMVILTS